MTEETTNFDSVKTRLDEIAEEVAREGISLDEALELYEEAVKLGLSACDLSEKDILVPEEPLEGPAEESAEEPTGESTEKPAEVTAEEPAEGAEAEASQENAEEDSVA